MNIRGTDQETTSRPISSYDFFCYKDKHFDLFKTWLLEMQGQHNQVFFKGHWFNAINWRVLKELEKSGINKMLKHDLLVFNNLGHFKFKC